MEQRKPIEVFDDRELNTVLHALRILQEIREPKRDGCHDNESRRKYGADDPGTSCDHFEEVNPLTTSEIETLCERLQLRPEPDEKARAYIAAAREQWATDELEIDDNPAISRGGDDDGVWVAARVWISDVDAGICRKCGQPGADGDDSWDGMCPPCADKESVECQECEAKVDPDDPYFATPCGTFCGNCMKNKHAKECGVCAGEFDLKGASDGD